MQDAVDVLQDIRVPETQDADAAPLKVAHSSSVACCLIDFGVSSSVELDREPGLLTVEVENVRSRRVLSSELDPLQAATSKVLPEKALAVSRVAAELSDVGERVAMTHHC